jgi:hypothetical protein
MNERMTARCLCGGIECEIAPPTITTTHCHCAYCRRAHGAAVVTWLLVPEKQFRLAKGDDLLRWYDSSESSRRAFCARCGSSMLFQSELAPGEMHVARALIDGDVDHEAELHCFTDHAVSWLHVDDELPRLASDHEILAHYKRVPPAK